MWVGLLQSTGSLEKHQRRRNPGIRNLCIELQPQLSPGSSAADLPCGHHTYPSVDYMRGRELFTELDLLGCRGATERWLLRLGRKLSGEAATLQGKEGQRQLPPRSPALSSSFPSKMIGILSLINKNPSNPKAAIWVQLHMPPKM